MLITQQCCNFSIFQLLFHNIDFVIWLQYFILSLIKETNAREHKKKIFVYLKKNKKYFTLLNAFPQQKKVSRYHENTI